LKAGANVNATSKNGQYALHNATYAANAEVVRYLLKIGANPDINDGLRNETALNLAIRVKNEPANRNYESLSKSYDEVIAVLKPVTSISKQIANASTNLAEPNPVINSVAECLKLKAALKICENIPWPVSLGCNALAKSNYGTSYCQI
jgi:ankyrin repeat protein